MKALERTLHREARTCGMLILWLDCDSEGENIAYEVMTVCQSVNPGIAVKRARFSAITHQDVRYALQHLSTLDPSMNAMVEARQVSPTRHLKTSGPPTPLSCRILHGCIPFQSNSSCTAVR